MSDEILEHNEELVDAFLTNVMEVGHIDEDSIPDSIQDKVAAIYNHFLRNREPGDIILASCSVGHEGMFFFSYLVSHSYLLYLEEQRDQLYKEYEKLVRGVPAFKIFPTNTLFILGSCSKQRVPHL